jgi:hypothetical protein
MDGCIRKLATTASSRLLEVLTKVYVFYFPPDIEKSEARLISREIKESTKGSKILSRV